MSVTADRVIHYFASEDDLANLYKNAIAFIFPSTYEGFGLPILESFTYGCPTLLNNKSCFPEIGGNGALFFESDAYHSNLVERMEQIYNMSFENKQSLIKCGYEQLAKFSWKESANKLVDLYESLKSKQL